MGKGKKGASSRSTMDLQELDRSSQCSDATWSSCPEPVVKSEEDEFQETLDSLFEKRGSTRERALEQIIKFLLADLRDEECENNVATIVGRCINGIRKGGSAESALSSNVLGLLFISLAEPGERLLEEVTPDLLKAARPSSTGKSSSGGEARQAAIEALSIATFVAAADDEHTSSTMDRLQGLWGPGDPGCRAAALRGWSLLLTSLNRLPNSGQVEEMLQLLAEQLESSGDVEVRAAAGEAVALLYHVAGMAGGPGTSDDEDAADDVSGSSRDEALDGVSGLDEVVDRMRDMATHNRNSALRRSKRDKASLRATFRGLVGAVEDGAVQPVKIKLQHGDTLVVDTLAGLVVLGAFRRYLAGGLQVHLQRNPLLHDVFSFSPSASRPEKLSGAEKRAYRSPHSAACKGREAHRRGSRAQKHATFGGFDGDY